jgi:membrane protein YqaA with SNARE-associated domain
MEFLATPEAGLMGLFLASFLAATVLPGGSEAAFVALVLVHPEQALAALLLATLGNTLGGMTTYGMGRLLPQHLAPAKSALARRWGAQVLLLSWTPLVGDALCAAAGWLRLPWLACLFWMALGKSMRYALLLWVAQ